MVSMLAKRKAVGLSLTDPPKDWNQSSVNLKHRKIILDQLLAKKKIECLKTKQAGLESLIGAKRTHSQLSKSMTLKELQDQVAER